jgi:hypothetical protein
MKRFGKEMLQEALSLLGEVLEKENQPLQHFVVCGGSSLLALDLVSRTATRDVDILARFEDRQLIQAKPLPDFVREAAESVGTELGLPENWFNTGPADDSFFRFGFPSGIEERLTPQRYGSSLTISFISRYDQIFFKLYAAGDQGPGRHVQDLKDLKPASEELLEAARWTRKHDPSEGFRMVLRQLLNHLGHGEIAEQI